jgi:hypothetical protein
MNAAIIAGVTVERVRKELMVSIQKNAGMILAWELAGVPLFA